MVVAEAPAKIKFWSPIEKHIVHKTWDECGPREQDWIRQRQPDMVPDNARVQTDGGRYAELVDLFMERYRTAEALWKEGRTDLDKANANHEMHEYREAVITLREASAIPEETDAWFVYAPGEMVPVRIPPRLDEFKLTPLYEPIIFTNHVYRTNDGICIAWLRKMIRNGDNPNLKELTGDEWGMYPLIGIDNAIIGLVPKATYQSAVDRGQARARVWPCRISRRRTSASSGASGHGWRWASRWRRGSGARPSGTSGSCSSNYARTTGYSSSRNRRCRGSFAITSSRSS
jgi:hypothetical protein